MAITPQNLAFIDAVEEARLQALWFFAEYYWGDEVWEEGYEIDKNDTYWIGNNLSIGDIFVSLDDIEMIAREEIPWKVFLSWYDFSLCREFSEMRLNLHTFHQLWKGDETILENPEEWVKNWRAENDNRINTPEFKAEMEAREKKLLDGFKKELDAIEKTNKSLQ